ncbi:MAG TPA: hypothetical protein VJR03_08745 [Nitrospira sp.]|nr:hypothetical protein [Nitrospira sp.]
MCFAFTVLATLSGCSSGGNDGTSTGLAAPSSYTAYSGTDPKPSPYPPPPLGAANSILVDPTFGSRILRVTDANTAAGWSLIPEDAGYFRTWNASASAFKLINTNGVSYWAEFDAANFQVGALHRLNIDYSWEWSATDPNSLYFLNGSQLSRYNIAADAATNLGGPYNGDQVVFHVAVVGQDNWVCSVAGAGAQDTYTELFCVNPGTSENKLIDVVNKTINGVAQNDPNWPTSASGETLGIHSYYGSAGGAWLGVVFHQASWNPNGEAVLNLNTNTWSLKTSADNYWGGHASLGNGRFVNAAGSRNGSDSRGAVVRDPNNLMDSSQYSFIMQPPSTVGWYDADHSSWFNSSTNPGAPILFSRYNTGTPPTPMAWYGEIVLAATDGSNTVWRVAHNHNAGGSFYGQAFAQISNDGRWALFSSDWDGTLGGSSGDFGLPTRIDTFIVELR